MKLKDSDNKLFEILSWNCAKQKSFNVKCVNGRNKNFTH